MRSAQAADAAELARLLTAAGASASPREMVDRMEAMRAHAASACLVAAGYEGLSGVVAVEWAPTLLHSRPVARITLLLVDIGERRRGIGRLLLKSASQAARVAGCDALEWSTRDREAEADAFRLASGFLPQGSSFARSLRRRA